jgi:peptide-methionine (S)-S-oxide reductase
MNTISIGKRASVLARPLRMLLLAAAAFQPAAAWAKDVHVIPAPAVDEPTAAGDETAVFAGGCFWGVQGVFQHVKGVVSATSGYAGGAANTARYEMVSTGETGHGESVRVVFDPKAVSYGHLLQIFFSVAHDPTLLNRQGPDRGTQYRSAIFPQNDEQARVAKAYIAQLDGTHIYDGPIVTAIEPGKSFYRAEAYHQNFLTNNPTYPYIVINDLPKVDSLKKLFPEDYRSDPVLVERGGK